MISSATIIALMRQLWPQVTTAAASDAWCEAWIPNIRSFAGTNFGTYQTYAFAHLLAHFAYRVDQNGILGSGGAGIGAVMSLGTGKLSASFGAGMEGLIVGMTDAEFGTTRPGCAYLALRGTIASINAPRVF